MNMIFTAIVTIGALLAIAIFVRKRIKKAFLEVQPRIYREFPNERYSTWQYTTYEIGRDCLGRKPKGPMATKR